MAAILTLAQQVNKGLRGTPLLRCAPQAWICLLRSPTLAGDTLLAAKLPLGGLFKRAVGIVPINLAANKFNPLSCGVSATRC